MKPKHEESSEAARSEQQEHPERQQQGRGSLYGLPTPTLHGIVLERVTSSTYLGLTLTKPAGLECS